jgi:multiple sugar transport system permease protein
MSFTNWNLKPAVPLEYCGIRNYADLLGLHALDEGNPVVLTAYLASVFLVCAGTLGMLWTTVRKFPGVRLAGLLLCALSVVAAGIGLFRGGGTGIVLAAAVAFICGLSTAAREDVDWRPGIGVAPVVSIAAGVLGLWLLHTQMWSAYECRDYRFWYSFYNTAYLMLGIPPAILGSLLLAMLANDTFRLGPLTYRAAGALLCLAGGAINAAIVWRLGFPSAAALCAALWIIAALGLLSGVVAFRTIFYLPTFTAGIALMVLWKVMYSPETGPINLTLEYIFDWFGWNLAPPRWLVSIAWAKPALILMGIWTAIGGTNMLLYLAGLSNTPQQLLDAAKVDGAGAWKRFRHVTWPQLAPTTFFISIMSIIGGLQGGFEQARVMTLGGPAYSTTTLSYLIYTKAFTELEFGYAAAISWVLFAMVFAGAAINWRFGKNLDVGY